MWEHKKTTLNLQKVYSRCSVVFLCCFHPCLVSVHYSGQSLLGWIFSETFSLLSVVFWGVPKELPKKTNTLLCWRRVLSALKTDAFSAATIAWKSALELQPHTCTQQDTNHFQTDVTSKWLLLTGTYLWKPAVSRSRTHLQVCHNYKLYIFCPNQELFPVTELDSFTARLQNWLACSRTGQAWWGYHLGL